MKPLLVLQAAADSAYEWAFKHETIFSPSEVPDEIYRELLNDLIFGSFCAQISIFEFSLNYNKDDNIVRAAVIHYTLLQLENHEYRNNVKDNKEIIKFKTVMLSIKTAFKDNLETSYEQLKTLREQIQGSKIDDYEETFVHNPDTCEFCITERLQAENNMENDSQVKH